MNWRSWTPTRWICCLSDGGVDHRRHTSCRELIRDPISITQLDESARQHGIWRVRALSSDNRCLFLGVVWIVVMMCTFVYAGAPG
jgi:hypothetical protein